MTTTPRNLQLHTDYLHVPTGKIGWACTLSPHVPDPFTTFSPGRSQFGPGAAQNFTARLADLVRWTPPPLHDPVALSKWVDA